MVSMMSLFAMVIAAANIVDHVQSHGFIANPPPSWKKGKTGNEEWIVQIEPQWKGDWNKARNDDEFLATFKQIAAANNFKNARSLLDSDPVYGADCGYTDPNGTPVDPPSDGTATFSRGIAHVGRCEVWIDEKIALQKDDCQAAFGNGTIEYKSVLKPIDYSLCDKDKCLMRFYWIALQGVEEKFVWQIYKNCIPLKGSSGGKVGDANTTQNPAQVSTSDGNTNSGRNAADDDVTQIASTSADSKSASTTPVNPPLSNKPHEIMSVPTSGGKCRHRR